MSHVVEIKTKIRNLESLKKAVHKLGWQWHQKSSYKWYGQWVGDYPLPDGVSVDELGKCDFAISVPGADYEIGIVSKNNEWGLFYDFWRSGGLTQSHIDQLIQTYAVEEVYDELSQKGTVFTTMNPDGSIVLELELHH